MLTAIEVAPHKGKHVAVDWFFRLLAESHGAAATAIVLSGGDGDGASGVKSIKGRGGLTRAQDPAEAAQPGMPQSAIETDMVDWILTVNQMPDRLIEYHNLGKKLQRAGPDATALSPGEIPEEEREEHTLREILTFVKTVTGHDFSGYKRATVRLRIGRRMQVNRVENLGGYVACLRTHSGECTALPQDLLISVTHFFPRSKSIRSLGRHSAGVV